MHVAKAAPSRLHWNVLPASFELKEKLALVWFVDAGGPELIVVSGAVTSMAQV